MTASEFWNWLNDFAPAIGVVFTVIGAIGFLIKHFISKPGEHKPLRTNEPASPSPEPLSYLESAPPNFTGREADIKRLRAALLADNGSGTAITSVEGIGGIGKTALALHVAHQLKREGHFPGGQMFIDLRGFSPGLEPMTPEEALITLLHRMDPAAELPDTVPELRLHWLSATADKKMLVFLDNIRDEEQVRPLLSGDRACVVIVTSRQNLALPGLERISLALMPPDDAADLAMKIGNSHSETRLGRSDAERLVELCGYLPLAIRIAASTLDVKSNLVVDEFLTHLADHKTKLATLKLGNEGVAVSLASNLDVLDDESRRHWRALSVFAGSFTGAATKHVWELEAADALLGEFVAQNLLTFDQEATRFHLHDLLRAMALQELESHPDETTAARLAHAEHYFKVLAAADALYHKGDDEVFKGLAVLDLELENITAGQQWASGNLENDDRAAHLAMRYAHFRCLGLRLSPDVNLRWLKSALDAARHLGNRESEAMALGNLGNLYQTRGELDRAEEMYRKSLEIEEALGRKEGMATDYGNLGNLYRTRGELDRAEEMYRKSLEIEEALGRKEGMANAYGNLGSLYMTRGEFDRAEEMHRKSLEIEEALGRKEGMASDYGNLGNLYLSRGELDRAEKMYHKSLELDEALGRKEGMASQYGNLGIIYRAKGDLDRAEGFLRKSLEMSRSLNDTVRVANQLGNLGNVYRDRSDIEKAREMYRESMELFEKIGAIPMKEKLERMLEKI